MSKGHIDTKLERTQGTNGELGGWLQGPDTYLWFGVNGKCEGTLSGYKLYRLARAICRQFEREDKP